MSAERKAPDVALIHGVTEDRRGLCVLRHRDDRLEAGTVRPLEHGKPIQGEIVRLSPRPEMPLVCDVETELLVNPATETTPADAAPAEPAKTESPAAEAPARIGAAARRGPARVTTERYRANWDAVFRRPKREPLN